MDTLGYILKKYDLGLSEKIEIPNVGRNDLASLLSELNFKVGVEVGVECGLYSEVLCRNNPQMKIYGVDPWESLEACIKNSPKRRTDNHSSQKTCDRYYESAMRRLAPYPNSIILKEYSVDAVKRFEDKSLDFVYIDANHDYSFVIDDITWWSKKVRKGGIVSGHDYYNTSSSSKVTMQVKRAVNDYVKENGIKPLIIWGAHAVIPGMIRDKWRSWMWVKS